MQDGTGAILLLVPEHTPLLTTLSHGIGTAGFLLIEPAEGYDACLLSVTASVLGGLLGVLTVLSGSRGGLGKSNSGIEDLLAVTLDLLLMSATSFSCLACTSDLCLFVLNGVLLDVVWFLTPSGALLALF